MTPKPTTFSDAGLSIAVVRPNAGMSKSHASPLQKPYGIRLPFSGAINNEPYRVMQDQRLEVISVLPNSGTRRGMRAVVTVPRFKPRCGSTELLLVLNCPGQIVPTSSQRRSPAIAFRYLLKMRS